MTRHAASSTQTRILKKDVIEQSQQAAHIVHDAQRAIKAIKEEAQKQGFLAGKAEAAALLISAQKTRDQMLRQSEKDILDLCIHTAKQLVQAELASKPEHIQSIVAHALSHALQAKHITLVVHPEDQPLLGAFVQNDGHTSLHIKIDQTLRRGDCVVLSELGDVDARIETRLSYLKQELLKA